MQSNRNVNVTCSTLEEYIKNAKTLKLFYDVFLAAKPGVKVSDYALSLPTLRDSQTAGYKLAELSVGGEAILAGGAMGLFYQTPDATWHYFTTTQELKTCSAYDTPDLKKAYLGQKCTINTYADGTVKL